jgi:hypothetical protein
MSPSIKQKKAILVFLVALACFGLSPMAQALLPPPPPDGGYPNQNTAGDAPKKQTLTARKEFTPSFPLRAWATQFSCLPESRKML